MSTVLVWLRHDLRLHDQPVLQAACKLGAQHLLPVVCLPDVQATTRWGFAHIGPHRRAWLANTLQNLLHRFQDGGRLALGAVSFIDIETRPRGLLVQAFHTFPEDRAIVKSQSLFEFT